MSSKNSEDKNRDNSDQDIVYEDNVFDATSDDTANIQDVENDSDDETDVAVAQNKINKLKEDLKRIQAEKDEYLQGWQRSQADYANLKRRTEEEKDNIRKYGSEKIILDLIKVLDSFEMAFNDQDTWQKAPENWRIGVESIYNQLLSVLGKNSVIIVNPVKELFDPNIHHCVEVVQTKNQEEDGLIIEVIQKGYSLGEKNIRPAMVRVGKFEK